MKVMRLVVLLAVLASDLLSADSKAVSLLVRVMPQAVVTMQGPDIVGVTIRLSAMSQAQLWIAASCSVPSAAGRTIAQSGTYVFPVSTLSGTGRLVCLSSAMDGLLESAALIVPILEAARCANSTCYLL